MVIRDYDPSRDRAAALRVFREVGWLPKGTEPVWDTVLATGRALVAEIGGDAECAVCTAPGEMRYLEADLPFVEVTAVATGWVARRGGAAARTLARALAADAAEGALLARVCVFDQGFYDRLGFGPGPYDHWFEFDPATLLVASQRPSPCRLIPTDCAAIHASRCARLRRHGGVVYPSSRITEVELSWGDDGFGLGYCDGPNGELTHHFWGRARHPEHGPYRVSWLAYQTREQLLELLALLKGLSDQIALVRMREPAGVQLQDLLERPFRHRRITERSQFENRASAAAFWQVRILNLPGCLARSRIPWGEVRFNLELSDPIAALLGPDAPWHGVAGEYVVTLGPESRADSGVDSSLPTMKASVNAFSRLWLGVGPASGLAATDDLAAPEELLARLDDVLRLPRPQPDWDF